MQKHTQVYLEYFWKEQHEVMCEVCERQAIDIHHIIKRSKFGSKTKHLRDVIENLIAVCRNCHERAHMQRKPYLTIEQLQEIHNRNL